MFQPFANGRDFIKPPKASKKSPTQTAESKRTKKKMGCKADGEDEYRSNLSVVRISSNRPTKQTAFSSPFTYTKPEKPINAIAIMLAVMSAIGMPRKAFGTSLSERVSRMPAKRIIARP